MERPNRETSHLGRKYAFAAILALGTVFPAAAEAGDKRGDDNQASRILTKPITIGDQGSFYVGGKTLTHSSGQTSQKGHLYASFQKPVKPRKYPIVMWHGGGETGKTFESTADGREGFNTLFLRRDFSVYIVDEPFVGRGSVPTDPVTIDPFFRDQASFMSFRIGTWSPPGGPQFYPGVQFSRDPEILKQIQRQQGRNLLPPPGTPRALAPDGVIFEALPVPEAPDAGAALFDKIGPSILLTHSHGGYLGWALALRSNNVKGIVAYEPVRFIFPAGELPTDLGPFFGPTTPAERAAMEVPLAEFKKLTRFPIQIVYGDNLDQPGQTGSFATYWRDATRGAAQFAAAIKRHGGKVEIVRLPDVGLHGNTHFPFADQNNVKVADLMSQWLKRQKLDEYPKRYDGRHW
jgi:hypothetical protein